MTNHDAVLAAINALQIAGRLEPEDQALTAAVETLAQAVDTKPDNASLWREYLRALGMLAELKGAGVDAFDAFLADLRTSLGDPAQS